jgi:hypothetical protein
MPKATVHTGPSNAGNAKPVDLHAPHQPPPAAPGPVEIPLSAALHS